MSSKCSWSQFYITNQIPFSCDESRQLQAAFKTHSRRHEDEEEEEQVATVSVAAAKKTSMDAKVAAVLSKLEVIFALN